MWKNYYCIVVEEGVLAKKISGGDCLIPVSRSKGQRSRSPGSLMLTHIVRHVFEMSRPTNFKLGIRMENDDPYQLQAP